MEKTVKILVVDDSPDTHTLVDFLFGKAGRTGSKSVVVHAENGKEALNRLAEHPDLDVIILDLSMPVMDGFTFLEHWNRDARFRSIPVCVFTGNKKEAAKALSLGARDFVVKSGDEQELRLRLMNLVEGKRRAQATDRAKIDFLAVVSHELRTPMNGIFGMAQAIRDSGVNSEQTGYLEALELSSKRMLAMVNNVLDFLESENPLQAFPRVPFALRRTLYATLEHHAAEARRNAVSTQVVVDSAVPDKLVGLPDKLHLVLHHLIGNAIKFSPGGQVVVSADLGEKAANGVFLSFCVRDTGTGFSEESRQRIVEPFIQLDGSQTRAFGGLGLGLSIAERVIQHLGGALEIQSQPGQGSTFRFTCPFEVASEIEA